MHFWELQQKKCIETCKFKISFKMHFWKLHLKLQYFKTAFKNKLSEKCIKMLSKNANFIIIIVSENELEVFEKHSLKKQPKIRH